MNRLASWIAALGLALGFGSILLHAENARPQVVREPAVAGLFYPRDATELAQTVDAYLATAKSERTGELKALICPHAGYLYSGPVAASGFALLRGLSFKTVVLLSPSHYAQLDRAAVSSAEVYRTPLGDVPISPRARELGAVAPFAINPRSWVQRPDWAPQASRPLPPRGEDQADTWEHSGEVEVPFLQKSLSGFDLVPVVMGEVDPARAGRALDRFVDDGTLLVVSSDLSHYHEYTDAQKRDRECVDAICALDLRRAARQEACGLTPILTVMHLAKQRGWEPRLLDLRNSGDVSGDKSRVVGYAAIAFYGRPAATGTLTAAERKTLLALARRTVRAAAAGQAPSGDTGADATPAFAVPRGVFVTLTQHGQLRGCIGAIVAQEPLYTAVQSNARHAALDDPRFLPVRPSEVDQLEIEISVLTPPKPLEFSSPDDLLRKLRPGVDGVVLRIAAGGATFLPQVWEQLPDKVEFLNHLAEKAGGRAADWRKPGTSVALYQVESFKESDR